MRKFLLLLCTGLFFALHNPQSNFAQENTEEIIFTFTSANDLIKTLESDEDKSIIFEISGIETTAQADVLMQNFYSAAKVVTGMTISEKKPSGLRDGSLFLYRTAKTSYFTKILITCGIQHIMVEHDLILTVDLNDKSKYFVK